MIALYQASFIAGDAHSAAPSARHCLDHHRKADLSGRLLPRFFLALHRPVASRRNRNPRPGERTREQEFCLPSGRMALAGGPTNLILRLAQNLGASGRFRRGSRSRGESRPRRRSPAALMIRSILRVAFGTGRRPDANGFIRQLDVETFQVGLGIDGDGLNPASSLQAQRMIRRAISPRFAMRIFLNIT